MSIFTASAGTFICFCLYKATFRYLNGEEDDTGKMNLCNEPAEESIECGITE